jgi:hypothetical protein
VSEINPDEQVFPNNVVKCLGIVMPSLGDPNELFVIKRPLRPTDPNKSVGIYSTLWQPNEDSYEMGHNNLLGQPVGAMPGEPTLSQYQIGIQTLVKHSDTEAALAISSILNKRIRAVLYRNDPLRLALGSLYVQDSTSRESMKRWGVRSQRYMSNEIEGKFVFVSVLDFWIETEMI